MIVLSVRRDGAAATKVVRPLESRVETAAQASTGFADFVRPRKDKRGVDLISDVLPFGRLWYDGPNAAAKAVGYAMHSSRSHDAVIRVYDAAGNVIETHEHNGELKSGDRQSRYGVSGLITTLG